MSKVIKKIHVSGLGNLVKKFETVNESNKVLPLVVKVDNTLYPLGQQRYITGGDWNLCVALDDNNNPISELNKGVTINNFISFVEDEAEDKCWHNDNRVAPFDACTSGDLFIALNLDDMEYYENLVESIEILEDKIILYTTKID